MKKLVLAVAAFAAVSALADQSVQGYYRKDGTYVQPYHRTAPDHNPYNNYSAQGNVNPWTGQAGTVNPYNQPQPIYTPPQPLYTPAQPKQCGYVYGQYVCR
jgi:hypothetical protein